MFKVQPRRVAKVAFHVATSAVVATAADAALTAVIGDSDDEETPSIHTGSLMIGCVTGYAMKSRTDRVVDWVADRRPRRKQTEDEQTPLVAVS